ncbi:hypothetical protein ACUULL_003613 [Vibrio cholerae]|uniref:hypothetical protein n=1 Tax=Vibrio cholerae TaxID=666 RepID=UPI00157AD5C7|nr:hypothetical protein [Vibrio cholerae]EKF9488652.1 hypothetical protein [Vibrio cholerae]HDI3197102.1 hypothetical protein [Vibrio cholerae]HDZ9392400.1 hypothetical protein [Vibrio cholerae]
MQKTIFLIVLFLSFSVEAKVGQRNDLTILQWHPSSSSRIHSPQYNGLTRVYFSEKSEWGSTSCRNDAADIKAEDTHLLSAMLAAFMSNKKVSIEVNDDLSKVDNVCKVTAAFITR